ncbi:hypothetical protein [Streptomyces broussonetiae]|uniref:Secreted protein n=1 Tax=Streptomyces broussonetiae TaxID=2686304 RepID=A0ABV5E915_9ACTN
MTEKGASWLLTATVTATSADEGGAGWRFIAVAVGCLGGLRGAEGGAEGVDGVSLEAESDVDVDGDGDGDGDANVGVAEEFLDDDEFDAGQPLPRSGGTSARACVST